MPFRIRSMPPPGPNTADDDDFDFSLPGHFPLDWQRVYSSRDERTEGMFGQGWSVMYEVSLVRTPGNADENCMTFVSGMGRRTDMEAVLPGVALQPR